MEIKTESSENLESYDQSLSDLQLTSEHPLLELVVDRVEVDAGNPVELLFQV